MHFSSEKDENSCSYKSAEMSMHLIDSSAAKALLLASQQQNPLGVIISMAMFGYFS
jgi:hypothetical protein